MIKVRVFYVWDEKLINECNRLPAVHGRAHMVHNLISAYGLLDKMKIVRSSPATYNDLQKFHSEIYLNHLKQFTDVDEEYMSNTTDEEFGIGYDCPPVANMFELVTNIAGGSLTAVKCLMLGMADVVINWCGGWHHAARSAASGFCYVNDIVVAIEMLKLKFPKILYIDLDVHHGNGVQDAYSLSKSVFTLSFHKYETGFYPGTGGIDDIGTESGKGYSCNFSLHEGYTNDTIEYAFKKVFSAVSNYFEPDAIVVQCGADSLAYDPNGGGNMTTSGYCACVRMVLDKRKPTVLLGGGGYNLANTARLWTTLTALAAGVDLDENIPEHNYWPQYGPSYKLTIEPTLAKDVNKMVYLDECIAKIKENLETYLGHNRDMEPELKRQKADVQHSNRTGGTTARNSRMTEKFGTNLNKSPQKTSADNNIVDVYEFVDL